MTPALLLIIPLIGAVVITLVFYVFGTALFGIDPGVLPEWARAGAAGGL